MSVRYCWVLSLLVWKLVLAAGILVFLLTPTNIYRQNLVSKNYKSPLNPRHFQFEAKHHFCSLPNETNPSFDKKEIFSEIDIPPNSVMSEWLMEMGKCRLKFEKAGYSKESCMCKVNPGYVLLICISILSIIVGLAQLFATRLFDGYETSVAFFGGLGWLFAFGFGAVFHAVWFDEVWLEETLYSQNYFQKPTEWTMAIVFAGIYFSLTLMEFLCLDPMRYADDEEGFERKKRKRSYKRALGRIIIFTAVRMDHLKLCSGDLWSIESEPEEVERRYRKGRRTGKKKPLFHKTWP